MTTTLTIETALSDYQARQARNAHPVGYFDNGGRWYPDDEEQQDCCEGLREPTRKFPYSLNRHCRTLTHVAHVHKVSPQDLRQALREAEGAPARQRRPVRKHQRFKAVVARTEDGVFESCYDPEYSYVIGRTAREKVKAEHGGGFYVYPSIALARTAELPPFAKKPTCIIEVEVWGRTVNYDGGKSAWTYMKPVRVAEMLPA